MAKVLIIDDEPSIVNIIEEIIVGHGHQAQAAFDGRKGLELARSGEFDLIISDIMMPYINGREILKAVRSDPRLERTRFVLMSAVAGLFSLDSSVAADGFIIKPFDIGVIDRLVETYLPEPEGKSQALFSTPLPLPLRLRPVLHHY